MTSDKDKVNPVQVDDHIKLLSYNLIADALSEPVLWPGGDIFNVVNYLYTSGNWGEDNDVFLIDMPSGAGDVPINLYTAFPVDGTIIVGEPSELAVVPLQRCVAMTRMFLSAPGGLCGEQVPGRRRPPGLPAGPGGQVRGLRPASVPRADLRSRAA